MTTYSKIYDQHRLRVDGLMGVATRERSERAHLPLRSTCLCFRFRQRYKDIMITGGPSGRLSTAASRDVMMTTTTMI